MVHFCQWSAPSVCQLLIVQDFWVLRLQELSGREPDARIICVPSLIVGISISPVNEGCSTHSMQWITNWRSIERPVLRTFFLASSLYLEILGSVRHKVSIEETYRKCRRNSVILYSDNRITYQHALHVFDHVFRGLVIHTRGNETIAFQVV